MEYKELSIALSNIQDRCIGLVNIRGNMELLMEHGEEISTSLSIGNLFGMSRLTFANSEFHITLFPDGKTMSEMMNDPIMFNDWCSNTLNVDGITWDEFERLS